MESFPSWQSRVGFSVRPAIVHTPLAEPLLKIAILGAGISGTTLARLLAADGHQVVVLEKTDRAGGLCKSQNVDGFTFDEAGGHIMFSKDKDVLGWMIDRVGGEDAVHQANRNTKIRWHDRWVPYPFENGVGHLTKDAIVDCMDGYIESHVERKLGAPCPENFKDWIMWRMGQGFADHFMVPYNEKIWKCDLATMSSGWVAGRVPEAPVRDILSSAVGVKSEGYTHQAVFWFPQKGGFEAMVVDEPNWIGWDPPAAGAVRCEVQWRHLGRTASCELDVQEGEVSVRFDEPQVAVAAGQGAAFYDSDRLLGGGWIQSATRSGLSLSDNPCE